MVEKAKNTHKLKFISANQMKTYSQILRLLLASCMCLIVTTGWSETEVNGETAGTLSSLISTSDKELKVTGFINGTDIKFMRQLVDENNLVSIDLTGAQVVTNNAYAYYTKDGKKYYTSLGAIGDFAFYDLSKLSSCLLPLTITKIGESAFDRSGLKSIVIPDKVTTVGYCAFSSCDLLTTVVIGKSVKEMGRGCFWGSGVKDVYAQPLTPPSVSDYLFGSNPTIHVYRGALEAYQNSRWAEYGTIVGDLTDEIIDGIEEIQNSKFKMNLRDRMRGPLSMT